jgi:hypothetical protein
MEVEGGVWVRQNGWRCLLRATPDGYGPLSGDLSFLACLLADRRSPTPCGPCTVLLGPRQQS